MLLPQTTIFVISTKHHHLHHWVAKHDWVHSLDTLLFNLKYSGLGPSGHGNYSYSKYDKGSEQKRSLASLLYNWDCTCHSLDCECISIQFVHEN